MIAFEFMFRGERCITEWLHWDDHKVGNGYEVDIIVGDEVWKNRGYLMIDYDNCYVDVCEDREIDEFESVIEHCPIIKVSMFGYDQSFVEEFHPNYNCDEIAWLDDCYCALDNEVENNAHWHYFSIDVVREDWEEILCNSIYDRDVFGRGEKKVAKLLKEHNFADVVDFGDYLATKYEKEIREDMDCYEREIMSEAIEEFERTMEIKDE